MVQTTSPSHNPVRDSCERAIADLLKAVPHTSGALIATIDGFDIAANLQPGLSPGRLAAMSSSVLAVATTMSTDSQLSQCRNLVIEADNGRILLMEIPVADAGLVLMVLCAPQANLGQLLWPVRQRSQALATQLTALGREAVRRAAHHPPPDLAAGMGETT